MKRKNSNVTNKAYRFLIQPNDEQKIFFAKTFGCCRYIWNRMLSDRKTSYEATGITEKLNPAYYKNDPACTWLSEVDSLALANVQLALENAYSAFFKGKRGYPKFKKKYKCSNSYTTNAVNGNIKFSDDTLVLPKIKSSIKVVCHRTVKPGGKLKSVTVTLEPSGRYYASLLFEYPKEDMSYVPDTDKIVGLDMSMAELFISSDNEYGDYPRFYRQVQARIAKEQRKLSHMKHKSNNYVKQQKKIASLYAKTKHQRTDFLHKASRKLVNKYDFIFVEDLNMRAMAQTLNLGKSVCDNGWGMFVNMLDYKLKEKGGMLIKIDRWFPSSKLCSCCGNVNSNLTLKDRTYICPVCGNVINRDYQAALNIKEEGLRILAEM